MTWSEGAARILGRAQEGSRQGLQDFLSVIDPQDQPAAMATIRVAAQSPEAQQFEVRIPVPAGGLRWIRGTAKGSFKDGQCRWVTGIVKDVTEERQLKEQLKRLQRSELFGLVASGFAHDFNNFLSVIRGRMDLAAEDRSLSESSRESVEHATRAVERAIDLTRQLTAFGRARPGQVEACDLNERVTGQLKLLSRIAGPDIQTRSSFGPDIPHVSGDPGMIDECLMFLAMGVRHRLPDGGQLMIRTEVVARGEGAVDRPPCVRVSFDFEPRMGIEKAQDQAQAQARQGGLNPAGDPAADLASAKELIEPCGGWLETASGPDGSGSFRINLLPAGTEAAGSSSHGEELPGGSERILLVGNDIGVRAFAAALLGRLGYTVGETATEMEAGRICEQRGGGVALAVVMSEGSGAGGSKENEPALKLRERQPGLRLLVIGAAGEPDAESEPSQRVWHLSRPFTPGQLACAVRNCLDQGGHDG